MNQIIKILSIFFGLISLWVVALGFVIKIDKYDTTQMVSTSNGISQISIKNTTMDKLKINIDKDFAFIEDDLDKKMNVVKIDKKEAYTNIYLLQKEIVDNSKISIIKFKIETKPFWYVIF